MTLLAEAYEDRQQPDRAIDVLEGLVAEQPEQVRPREWLAGLYEQVGRWQEAAAAWTSLSTQTPDSSRYRIRLATALVNSGDLEGGRKVLREVTQDWPREASAWFLLSQVERRAGNADAAEDAARHLTDLDPADRRGPIAMAEAKAARGDNRGVVDLLTPLVGAPSDDDVSSGRVRPARSGSGGRPAGDR